MTRPGRAPTGSENTRRERAIGAEIGSGNNDIRPHSITKRLCVPRRCCQPRQAAGSAESLPDLGRSGSLKKQGAHKQEEAGETCAPSRGLLRFRRTTGGPHASIAACAEATQEAKSCLADQLALLDIWLQESAQGRELLADRTLDEAREAALSLLANGLLDMRVTDLPRPGSGARRDCADDRAGGPAEFRMTPC